MDGRPADDDDTRRRASAAVLESADLLGAIADWLPLASALAAARVCSEWRATLRPPLTSEAAAATSACVVVGAAGAGAAGAADAILSRYRLPDAIFPAQLQRGGADSARARVAPDSAAELAAAASAAATAATAAAAAAAVPPSPSPSDADADAATAPPLSYLHTRPLLELHATPTSAAARAALFRALRHPDSCLRAVRLAGPAEQLAAPELLGLLHPRTLGQLEELSACACLVGQYVSEEETNDGLHATLRRWSHTPLNHSPEHAAQHPLREASLAALLPLAHSLHTLNVAHCRLWDGSLAIIGKHLHATLTSLNLNFCLDITNGGLAHLDRCFLLKELQLQRCWKLTPQGIDSFFRSIAVGHTKLVQERLLRREQQRQEQTDDDDAPPNSSGAGEGSIPESALESTDSQPTCALRLINLNENRQRGHGCLMALIPYCPLLEHAELSELSLSAMTVQTMAQRCPRLRYVNWSRVGSTTFAGLDGAAGVAAGTPAVRPVPGAATLPGLAAVGGAATSAAHLSSSQTSLSLLPGAGGEPAAPELSSLLASSLELRITDLCLSYLSSSCSSLRRLDLERAPLTDRGLKFLSHSYLPALEHLALWQCDEIGDEGVQFLLGADRERGKLAAVHPTLSFILLPANPRLISSASTTALVRLCPRLRHLMGFVPFANAAQVQELHALHAHTLRSLSCHVEERGSGGGGGGGRIGAASFRLLSSFRALECLDVTASRLQDADLQALLWRLAPRLRVLKLSRCAHITDDAFVWSNLHVAGAAAAGDAQVRDPAAAPCVAGGGAASGSDSSSPSPSSCSPVAATRAPSAHLPKPSFGAFVARRSAAAGADSASSVPAAGSAGPSARYFRPESIGWSCALELLYLNDLQRISSRTVCALAQLPSLRYVDIAACPQLAAEERRIEQLQSQLREQQAADQPITLAVHW